MFSPADPDLQRFFCDGFLSFPWKTNVFLFSFTNDSLIFSKKMKEYYQFTLV